MSLHQELLDITDLPIEDVAAFMETSTVIIPNSMRALRATKPCALNIDGFMYEIDVDDIIIDAPQKMKRMACGPELFEFLFNDLP